MSRSFSAICSLVKLVTDLRTYGSLVWVLLSTNSFLTFRFLIKNSCLIEDSNSMNSGMRRISSPNVSFNRVISLRRRSRIRVSDSSSSRKSDADPFPDDGSDEQDSGITVPECDPLFNS